MATGCIQLGNWQHAKAQRKLAAQAELDARRGDAPVNLSPTLVDAEALHARPVVVRGRFDPTRQFLVDNRIYREQAGYHVLTPLIIDGSDTQVLVNRGWIPANAHHDDIPQVDTPVGQVTLVGTAIVPASRFFTLGQDATGWQPVWQNLDLARFAHLAGHPVQPVVVQLAANAPAGFVRDWPRPDERFERHLSYAWQWYGFAASALLIWFALGWRRA